MPINKKNIVKNSLFLYARMILVMFCNFFIVRIVLKILGAEDYGINNVVGGIVSMLTFLTSTMNAASQRFFSFELGKNDLDKLQKYFTSSFWIYIGLVVLIIIIAETLGLWFLQNKMTISAERTDAAFWVYQCSIVSFIFTLIAIPYNAIIIAREKMNIFAYIGIFEVVLHVIAAYALYFISGDLLKAYAILLCITKSIPSLFYIFWGTFNFHECRIIRFWNKNIFSEIISFSSWNLFGALSSVLRSQGINILLNIFFNPVVNASRAIAFQVYSALNQFVLNFFKAVQPQIVKSYAAKELNSMFTLVFASTKYSFFLILLFALPLLFETNKFLLIWLSNYPANTVLFARLLIIIALQDSLIYPIQTALMATGNIREYQIVLGCLTILILPISYFFLNRGFPPEITLYITIAISLFAQLARILFMKKMLLMSIKEYIISIVFPIIAVVVCSCILPLFIKLYFESSFLRFSLICCASPISVLVCSYLIGMNEFEKNIFRKFVSKKVKACLKM